VTRLIQLISLNRMITWPPRRGGAEVHVFHDPDSKQLSLTVQIPSTPSTATYQKNPRKAPRRAEEAKELSASRRFRGP
jgi:hypothetical protein